MVALLLLVFSPGFGLTPVGAEATPVNLTGTWGLEYMGRDAPVKLTFVFKQEGEKLSGTFSGVGPYPKAPVIGAVKGNKVVFSWDLKGELAQTVTFKGAIESATRMTGTVGSPFCGDGCKWTGTKKK
jgi:hypothetical protein